MKNVILDVETCFKTLRHVVATNNVKKWKLYTILHDASSTRNKSRMQQNRTV